MTTWCAHSQRNDDGVCFACYDDLSAGAGSGVGSTQDGDAP